MTTKITVRPLIRTVVVVKERVILLGCALGQRQEWRGRNTLEFDGVRCQKPAMVAETETVIKKNLKGSRSVVERLRDIPFVMIILLPSKLV